jgi:predicted amidohydrolase
VSHTLAVAAVQIEAVPGRVADNLVEVERLARDAFASGARLVALPEFFTTPLITGAPASDAVLPAAANPALDLLRRLASEYHGDIGGSFLVADNGEVYNRYHFVTANGRVFTHDKDLPTMWENAFYTGGSDDGVFDTGAYRVGAAVCWELIREQTVARMHGRVDFAITGTHWWDMPNNWPLVRTALRSLSRRNHELSERAPAEFARRLGVPVLQASHSGDLRGDFHLLSGLDLSLPYATRFVGATQIVAADGQVLARRDTDEGAGWVAAEIDIGAARPSAADTPNRYWIPRLPLLHRLYWQHQNWVGRSLYRRRGRAHGLRAAHDQKHDS